MRDLEITKLSIQIKGITIQRSRVTYNSTVVTSHSHNII